MQRFEINNHPKLINFIIRETGVDLRTIDFNIFEKARAVLEACREMNIPITTVSDTLAKRHLFPLDFIADNLSHMMKEVKENEPQYRELMHDFDVALTQLHFQQRWLLTISRDEFGIPSDQLRDTWSYFEMLDDVPNWYDCIPL